MCLNPPFTASLIAYYLSFLTTPIPHHSIASYHQWSWMPKAILILFLFSLSFSLTKVNKHVTSLFWKKSGKLNILYLFIVKFLHCFSCSYVQRIIWHERFWQRILSLAFEKRNLSCGSYFHVFQNLSHLPILFCPRPFVQSCSYFRECTIF